MRGFQSKLAETSLFGQL